MSLSPVPDKLITSASSHFSIPPTTRASQDARTKAPLALRVRVTAQLVVPSTLLPRKAHLRRAEEHFHIVVPVGDGVRIALQVKDESSPHGKLARQWTVESLRAMLEANRDVLGITRTQDETTGFDIHLKTARPSHSPILNNLIPSGAPVAHLNLINISLQWSPVKHKQSLAGEDSQPAHTRGSQGDDYDGLLVEDDDEVPPGLAASSRLESEEERPGEDCQRQILAGLQKVFRFHLIKRFPLIFDAALLDYHQSLTLPKPLTSSIANFVSSSKRHKTPLARSANEILKNIFDEHERHVQRPVKELVDMRGEKLGLTPIVAGQKDQGPSTKRRRKKGEGEGEEEQRHDHSADYIFHLRVSVLEGLSETPGSHQEARVGWLLNQSFGRIGRGIWEEAREGRSRMSIHRIPLRASMEEVEAEEATQESSPKVADSDSPRPLLDPETLEDKYDDILMEDDELDEFECLCLADHTPNQDLDGQDDDLLDDDEAFKSFLSATAASGSQWLDEIRHGTRLPSSPFLNPHDVFMGHNPTSALRHATEPQEVSHFGHDTIIDDALLEFPDDLLSDNDTESPPISPTTPLEALPHNTIHVFRDSVGETPSLFHRKSPSTSISADDVHGALHDLSHTLHPFKTDSMSAQHASSASITSQNGAKVRWTIPGLSQNAKMTQGHALALDFSRAASGADGYDDVLED